MVARGKSTTGARPAEAAVSKSGEPAVTGPDKQSSPDVRTAVLVAIATAFGGIVATLGTAVIGYVTKTEDTKVKFVEFGISILRDDPKKSQTTAARGWAIELIEKNSGVKFDETSKIKLINEPLGYKLMNYSDYPDESLPSRSIGKAGTGIPLPLVPSVRSSPPQGRPGSSNFVQP